MKYEAEIDLMPWMVGQEGITLAIFLEQLADEVDTTPGARAAITADRIRALAKWAESRQPRALPDLYLGALNPDDAADQLARAAEEGTLYDIERARDVLDASIDKLYDRIAALEKQVEEKNT